MKNVWFIRHAESEANVGLATSDPGNINLTPRGHEQACALAAGIDLQPELIICSGYVRTQQTAQPLLEKYPEVPCLIWPIQEFDFLSPAACANTTVDERRPWVKAYWDACQPDLVHGDGAESFRAFQQRIISAIRLLEQRPENFIIVFAHGHVMRLIWQHLMNVRPSGTSAMQVFRDTVTQLPVPNTVVFKAAYDQRDWKVIDPACL